MKTSKSLHHSWSCSALESQGVTNFPCFWGNQTWCKSMVILRDYLITSYNNALFGLLIWWPLYLQTVRFSFFLFDVAPVVVVLILVGGMVDGRARKELTQLFKVGFSLFGNRWLIVFLSFWNAKILPVISDYQIARRSWEGRLVLVTENHPQKAVFHLLVHRHGLLR